MSSDSRRAPWEWSAEDIKKVGYEVVDLIAEHLTGLPERPVFQPVPAELQATFLNEAPPEHGTDPGDVLAAFKRTIEPYPFGNGHPRFFGWVNPPPAVMGIFGDALAAAMNPSCAGGNHAAIYVERQVVNWFKQILSFPSESFGLLVSGGSMASLNALAVARHMKAGFDVRARGLQQSPARLTVYKTREGHSCIQKAVELLGLGSDHVRIVDHDSGLRMRPESLDALIRADLAAGHAPMAVVASAGTVNTGAIDPLEDIAEICRQRDVWLHVDGAYGAPAVLTAAYRDRLRALARCDSVALDPHKWLYVPVEAGLVLIRHADAMRASFSLVPPYLRTMGGSTGVGGPPWFSEYGFQQTRGFRALKVWMALKHQGLSGYREAINHDLMMAGRLAEAVRKSPVLQLLQPQNLSIVCFRYAPPAMRHDAAALDATNRGLLDRLQLGGRAFLSGTVIDDTFWLRACIINYRTKEGDVDMLPPLVADLGDQAAGLTQSGRPH
jgi:glutamate/tyrosine decarboxylase-like PLP-dependent enzyme